MKLQAAGAILVVAAVCGVGALGQSRAAASNPPAPDMPALKGLAAVTVLSQTREGRAALQANYDVTGGIQNGTIRLPTPLPFAEEQLQALRDAAITGRNLEQLADGLGSTLGAAYMARAHTIRETQVADLSPDMAQLIAYALAISGNDSNTGKYLFANATTDGTHPVTPELQAILTGMHGEVDPFGKAYHLPAGSTNANPFGDSRPYQTEKHMLSFQGRDYWNALETSESYQRGPAMDLNKSPSYPSGHTTYGYTGSLLLGILVPERYPEMIARGAEYGTSRILVGAHYAMDVLGGRTLALYDMAHLLANDPAYLNREVRDKVTLADFRSQLQLVRGEMRTVLQTNCGSPVPACAVADRGRFNNTAANGKFYSSTLTYALPVVYSTTAQATEDVSRIAPEAGYLLTAAYPALTLKEADDLLTATEGPGGGFLDDGSAFGLYSRLNLYEAAVRARDLQAERGPATR